MSESRCILAPAARQSLAFLCLLASELSGYAAPCLRMIFHGDITKFAYLGTHHDAFAFA